MGFWMTPSFPDGHLIGLSITNRFEWDATIVLDCGPHTIEYASSGFCGVCPGDYPPCIPDGCPPGCSLAWQASMVINYGQGPIEFSSDCIGRHTHLIAEFIIPCPGPLFSDVLVLFSLGIVASVVLISQRRKS